MKKIILVVEDEPSILTGLTDLLKDEGFSVECACDGFEALRKYESKKPDLILLDIMIPEKSGYEVCKEIRKQDTITPILMLTAKGQEIDKVVGLELGADDYIVKPFGVKELLARVHAVLRRSKQHECIAQDDEPFSFGDISICPKTLKGKKNKKEFPLILREVQLLKLFIKYKGEVVKREKILNEVWGIKYEGTTRTLDQHIVKLRQKIEDDSANPKYIITVHGVGYRFCSKS